MPRSKDAVPLLDRRGLIKPYWDREIEPDISSEDTLPAKILGLLCILSFITAWISGFFNLSEYPGRIFLCFWILYVAYVIYIIIYPILIRVFWNRTFKINKLWISADELHPGDPLACHIQFYVKRPIHLKCITAILCAEEIYRSGDGDSNDGEKRTIYEQLQGKSYDENLIAGSLIDFSWTAQLLPDSPVTFTKKNKYLRWSVKVKITFKGCPAWEKSFPVTVIP